MALLTNQRNSVDVDLFDEIKELLKRYQPHLKADVSGDRILVHGIFLCESVLGIFDAFDIEVIIFPEFPLTEPLVRETGGRIPRVVDRHISANGSCCIEVWEYWLWKCEQPNFENFLLGPLRSFFVSQWHFEKYGDWPFGERSHYHAGMREAYSEMFDVPVDADFLRLVEILRGGPIKGHHPCPCGSGRRFRDCHRDHLNALRDQLLPQVIEQMWSRLSKQ
ncbi:MAG: SEC-C domain-containing protein [Novosphingobium sp.]